LAASIRKVTASELDCPTVIDLHSHILAGVDDGAKDLSESVEIARAAVADGVSLVAATPHVRHDFPTTPETMETLVEELRQALAAAGVALELRTGGEIALDRLDQLSPEDLRRFGLGGNPDYLLVETPYYGWPLDLSLRVTNLRRLGIRAVIAHPERNPEVQMQPELLRPLVEQGALVQVTSASIDGRLGAKTRASARELIDAELAHCVASDAHSPQVRAIGMSSAAAAIREEGIARWLTFDMPGAIAAGRDLPMRPQTDRPEVRRPWWKRG
jgi:protein-tyrosine phosphatase